MVKKCSRMCQDSRIWITHYVEKSALILEQSIQTHTSGPNILSVHNRIVFLHEKITVTVKKNMVKLMKMDGVYSVLISSQAVTCVQMEIHKLMTILS